jgi:DHA1 family multidrug resistance protein-like MFS transporter
MVGFSLFGDSMLYAVLPAEAIHLGLGASAVGWVLSLNRWVRLITNPIAARVCARLGWRGPFLAAIVVGGLTTVGYAVFESLWALLLARAVWGLCWSFLRHGGFEAVLETSLPETRGRNMGFLSGFFRMGSLVGMLAGGLLTDLIGYRPTLLLFGLSTICGLGIAFWDGWFTNGWPRTAEARLVTPGAPNLLLALRRPDWLGLFLCGLLVHGITSGVVTATLGYYLRLRMPDGWQAGSMLLGVATVTGILLSVRWVTGIGLNPLMGYLSDRFGRGRVLGIGALAGATGLVGLGAAPGLGLLTLAVMAIWLSESMMAPTLDGTAADLAGKGGAEAMGLYASGIDLGAATGPLVGYYVLAAGITLPTVYLWSAALFLLVIMLFQTLVRPRRAKPGVMTS